MSPSHHPSLILLVVKASISFKYVLTLNSLLLKYFLKLRILYNGTLE